MPSRPSQRRSDIRLLLGSAIALIIGGILVAGAILAITSRGKAPNVRGPLAFGLASDIRMKVHDGGPINIAGLSDVSLVDDVREAFRNCEVVVENDVNIAALGERAEGNGVGCDDLVVLSIGTGIGAGVIVGGRLMRGHHGAAGEVAWLTVDGEPPTSDTRARGMLEVAAAGEGIRRTLRHALRTNANSTLRATATVAEIFGAAARGDVAAQAVVAAEANLVARAVLSVVSVVDPEKVILAGGIGANPNLLRPVTEQLDLLAPFFVKVESSKLGERSGVVGALALARDIARNRLFGESGERIRHVVDGVAMSCRRIKVGHFLHVRNDPNESIPAPHTDFCFVNVK